MKAMLLFGLTIILANSQLKAQDLDTIYAVQIDSSDYRFEKNIEDYQTSENWTIWSFPMRNRLDTMKQQEQITANYSYQNINDQNLSTAWVTDVKSKDSTQRIEFEFHYSEHETYGSAYQFYGQVNLFNGLCESLVKWKNSSRLKTIQVLYNDSVICVVQLLDVWHFQYFNLDKYFKNKYLKKHLNAPFEMKEGDRLAFEIIELYPGTKYANGALSEFMIQGAAN
ncbi:MAG: hypothetical protein QNK23_08480 [Crocinitomicaceae bacterium]|nr:hypothetical protein [Crocinitomicaceae bacterium]